MSRKDEYVQKMHAKLDEWSAGIDQLIAKASSLKAEAQTEHQARVQELRGKRDEAMKKLSEVQGASDHAWEDLKAGMELASKAVGEAFDSARSRFK